MSARRPDRATTEPTPHKETAAVISRPRLLCALALALALLAAALAPAAASAAGPQISVKSLAPTHVTPGEPLLFYVTVFDAGDAPFSGNLTLKYTFPAGVSLGDPEADHSPAPACVQAGQVDECTIDTTDIPIGYGMRYRTFSTVDSGASGVLSGQIEVSGGGAANTVTVPLAFDTSPIGPFAIKDLEVGFDDGPVVPATQAAAVPAQVDTRFETVTHAVSLFEFPIPDLTLPAPPESFRDVITHVPTGLIGNPTATAAKCTDAQLATLFVGSGAQQIPICPRDSQVGVALINAKDVSPVYNLVPPRGVPAEFGIYYQGVIVNLRAALRPSDYGVDIISARSSSSVPIPEFEISFWGTPTDSSHDNLRAECTAQLYGASGELCPSQAPRTPFLRLPTSCSGPLPWSLEMNTYQHPDTFVHKETSTPALTGCQNVPFEPRLSLAPSDPAAHTTSGLDVSLSIPQENGPNGISQADLRQASVALPEGVSVNPASAEGLAACSDAQLRLGLEGPSECPDAAKLGSVEITTPLLNHPISGAVYLRSQASQDPESGDLYRLAIELRSDDDGIAIKLPGSLRANARTGQLTASFSELPQLPFEAMQLHFKTGPRAPLTTPQSCGTYSAHAVLTGWNGAVRSIDPSFTVSQNCTAPGFAPGFEAGVTDPTAGTYSPFTLRVTRDPGQPNISRIDATLPEGELAKIAGVPLCSDAQAASGSCPAASRIGRVRAGVGEGSLPLFLPQPGKAPASVYFAGPYKGAPYSIVAEVPAQAGPFDLGTVLVRSALAVDPRSVQVSVTSDPLPQIFGGVPVAYRDVRIEVDRDRYTLNPTDCEPMAVQGTIGSSAGSSADVSDRFQVTDCANLGFKPTLALTLKGKTKRSGHPALKAVLTYPQKGDYANIARAQVSLPHAEFLDQGNIGTVCTQPQLKAKACPAKSIYGKAKAWSPLLDKPLEGPVYLGVGYGHKLPDLVADLDGQIRVLLNGRVDTGPNEGIRNTFEAVPDAPVSRFVLELKGGKKFGLLENSENLCRKATRAEAKFVAQNGRQLTLKPQLRVSCPKKRGGRR